MVKAVLHSSHYLLRVHATPSSRPCDIKPRREEMEERRKGRRLGNSLENCPCRRGCEPRENASFAVANAEIDVL